jgi:hypothetical protein
MNDDEEAATMFDEFDQVVECRGGNNVVVTTEDIGWVLGYSAVVLVTIPSTIGFDDGVVVVGTQLCEVG